MEVEKSYTTPSYLISGIHPISVHVVGCGGTGSALIENLVCLNYALKGLQHPGIYLEAWDNDKVETHNVGRQHYSVHDIGKYKAAALINRINREHNLRWVSRSKRYKANEGANIIFTCVDSFQSRREIYREIAKSKCRQSFMGEVYEKYFWIDCGNGKDFGQIIVGTLDKPKFKLPTFVERYPDKTVSENTPSCSMAESLGKQDLNINRQIALYAMDILWRMLRTGKVDIAGMYVNHKIYQTSSIPVC